VKYDEAVIAALRVCWACLDGPTGTRLAPALPALVAALRRHGELDIDDELAVLLCAMSAATIDRRLAQGQRFRGFSDLRNTACHLRATGYQLGRAPMRRRLSALTGLILAALALRAGCAPSHHNTTAQSRASFESAKATMSEVLGRSPARPSVMAARLFVQRLSTGGRDGAALLNEFGWHCLGWRHQRGPGIRVAQPGRHGAQREVGRGHIGQVGPGDWERHRRAGPQPRAVCGGDAAAAGPRRVEKDLAVAVGVDEGGRGKGGVEGLGPHRQCPPGPSVARTLGVVPAGMAEPPAIIRGARSAFFGDGLPLNRPGGCPTGPSTEIISGTLLVIVPLDCSMPQGYERLAGIAADRSRWYRSAAFL
jgi:hypothetical protein